MSRLPVPAAGPCAPIVGHSRARTGHMAGTTALGPEGTVLGRED